MTKKERLTSLLNEGSEFVDKKLTSDNNKFIAWKNSLIRFIEQYYGKDSTVASQFRKVRFGPAIFTVETEEHVFEDYFNDGMNEILEDLKRLINELDDLEEIKTKNENGKNPIMNIQIDASNKNNVSNSNINSLNIMSYDEIRNEIENNTFLDDKSIKELLDKLNEIIEIEKSNDSKAKKWNAAKKIFAFILDKGADIAIMYIPLILQAISK